MAGRGPFELLDGILGMHETLARHRRVGVRAQVHVGVAQQRQNRVIERRGRDLNLAAGGSLAILGDDAVQELQLDAGQQRLVLLGEAAPLFHEAADPRVTLEVERIHPGELVPDLQIAQIVDGEPAGRRALVGVGRQRPAAPRQQFGVARIDVDHPLALRVEEVVEDEVDVGRRPARRPA